MEVSELYHVYEKEFTEGCERLQLIESSQKNHPAIEKLIQQLTTTQRQLDVELCTLPSHLKIDYDRTVHSHLMQLKPFKKILSDKKIAAKKLKRAQQQTKETPQERNFREKSEQNDRLSESKRLLYGMEAMSDSISDTLVGQTQKLIGMKDKTKDVQNLLDKANNLVDSMWFKQKKNKLILGVLASVIVLFILYRIL